LNATTIATTAPIEAIKYHAGSFVRQAGQRVRAAATTLSQLGHFIELG
jgi:rhodanese-related sulfurtransferase